MPRIVADLDDALDAAGLGDIPLRLNVTGLPERLRPAVHVRDRRSSGRTKSDLRPLRGRRRRRPAARTVASPSAPSSTRCRSCSAPLFERYRVEGGRRRGLRRLLRPRHPRRRTGLGGPAPPGDEASRRRLMHVPFSLDVAGRPVLVVGDGDRAERRATVFADAGAVVTRLSTSAIPRRYVAGHWLVIVDAEPDENGAVFEDAEAAGVWCNAVDDPGTARSCSRPSCAAARSRWPCRRGASPALASWLRRELEAAWWPRVRRRGPAAGRGAAPHPRRRRAPPRASTGRPASRPTWPLRSRQPRRASPGSRRWRWTWVTRPVAAVHQCSRRAGGSRFHAATARRARSSATAWATPGAVAAIVPCQRRRIDAVEVAALHPLHLGVAVDDGTEGVGVGGVEAHGVHVPMPVANGGWCDGHDRWASTVPPAASASSHASWSASRRPVGSPERDESRTTTRTGPSITNWT